MTADTTSQEESNLATAREYMAIAYDPQRASAEAVSHLCAPSTRFIAPTTFPGISTLQAYAEAHREMMKELADLHIVRFDVAFAKGDHVCLRYTATASHCGEPHGDLPATGRSARWTASAIFRLQDGKLVEFIKDWDKLSMWVQLGWPASECLPSESLDLAEARFGAAEHATVH